MLVSLDPVYLWTSASFLCKSTNEAVKGLPGGHVSVKTFTVFLPHYQQLPQQMRLSPSPNNLCSSSLTQLALLPLLSIHSLSTPPPPPFSLYLHHQPICARLVLCRHLQQHHRRWRKFCERGGGEKINK